MQFTFSAERPESFGADAIAFFLAEREKLDGALRRLDRRIGGHLAHALEDQEFTGKPDQVVVVHTHRKVSSGHVFLVGIGKPTSVDCFRRATATVVARARAHGAQTVAVVLPSAALRQVAAAAQAVAEGGLLGQYEFLKYKSAADDHKPRLRAVTVIAPARAKRRLLVGLSVGESFARATMLARDMVNEPSSQMTPRRIVETAKSIVAARRQLKLRVYNRPALQTLGAGGLLGIARGSDQPPYLIHLSYVPARAKRSIALVGKGITFDSGGINLKPEKGIENMKSDMAGAAAILGVFSALPALKPTVAVHGIIPTCENMPSGKALKPGDIVRALNGKTIEIRNTDAEGRVILADGLSYALRQKPDAVIDVATLTGACIVALGEEVAGVFSNSKPLVKGLLAAAGQTGESFWELPLVDAYRPLVKSDVADVDNISKVRYGGAITAALFLQEFVGQSPWAHLDIAGPAWAEREFAPYLQKGATGFGVRTLLQYLLTER